MEVEVLVSAMNQVDGKQLFHKMNIKGKVTIINQITNSQIQPITKEKRYD